jgi:DNA-directed RNA polymerase specialized sigma24 family protein
MMDEHHRQGKVDMKATGKMAATEPTSEEDLASLLPEEPEYFVRLLYVDYKLDLVRCIRRHTYGFLRNSEIPDVLHDAMLAILEKVKEPSFVPDKPMGMVNIIVRNKAVDARRKKMRLRKIGTPASDIANRSDQEYASVIDYVISDMNGSDLSVEYRLANEEERKRFIEVFPDIVAELPERQKLAVVAFVECFDEIRKKDKYRPIADVMSRMTGEVVDVAAARSALRAGLEKVRTELARHGIQFVERRDV